ncbi:MAG: alpha-amylase family glycosyl hydrolase [Paraglaciecola sp.]|uniref:alpha-amylase family protein n=1 Tax=Paraglaciecola sp. TaxID=1920173 RepID=UPI00273D30CD|nr:alpha-amylase family protein [Paraglaciecola sp.]MDP5032946.1 alpha-amylase family glycosyl hydrolase [Paraglaciecola sp.]MDP5133685.1 alpha-amylase family glycosyl hydrolase [Paraglaciecola sp.]
MNLLQESQRSLNRILISLDRSQLSKSDMAVFEARLNAEFPRLFELLFQLYGHRYDFYYYLQQLVDTLAQGFSQRSRALKSKDKKRLNDPNWYQSENMLGMACYVDLFAGDLTNLQAKIPYLKELGITYLHLMPLYDSPKGDSDGGYAVSDYRKVNEKLGDIDDLKTLAKALEKSGISLVLDFVFNHTSDEHRWAMAAKEGDSEYTDFYHMFDDRTLPDQYEHTLREIFPQVRRGNFTWNEQAKKWVWTTFNSFQWDLNYSNPAVFNGITDEMLFLANLGCEALRLDALAFIWKEMGTTCENQDKAHTLIQAFNSCLQISAPAVVFKSEAIVHPDEVLKYIDKQECQLSYNPLLMALVWESLATRKTQLLTQSMRKSFAISNQCAWVNYIRCHDDIGWTFDDDVAQQLGINGNDHRYFLNQFYTGRFEGSFASGVAFGENPSTGDCRVCGSLASLAGLESAIEHNDSQNIDHAIKRILLVHSIILSIGGVPLLYSGDELGLLNDYSYQHDDSKKHDDRWVNRIAVTDSAIDQANIPQSAQYKISQGLKTLIQIRQQNSIFGQAETQILETNNGHIFAFARHDNEGKTLLVLCNFSEFEQHVDSKIVDQLYSSLGHDLITQQSVSSNQGQIALQAYQVMWLA